MKPTVVLFDIDGTLITTNGAGRRALERCFAEFFGEANVFQDVPFAGMTDYGILRAGFESLGRPGLDTSRDQVVAHYLKVLAEELEATPGIRVHGGIVAVLDRLAERDHIAVGLGTGNLEAGAYLKLNYVGIGDRFGFGGFGSDHELRAELIRIGAERGATALNTVPAECRLIVIGDTPKDIHAGRANQALTVAVATGPFAADSLNTHEPDLAVATLADPAVLELLFDRMH